MSERLGSRTAFLCGYTNGLYGYLPTADEFPRGGYEVEWMPVVYGPKTGLLMPPKPDTAERVVAVVEQLVRASRGEAAPA